MRAALRTTALALAAALVPPAFGASLAHELHRSETTADYDAAAGSLQVACRLDSFDLEFALSLREERLVSLESTQDVEGLVEAYAREHFLLSVRGERRPFAWVGMELERRDAWLYFEFPDLPEWTGARVTQGLLFDVNPTQENRLTLRHAGERYTVQLTPEAPRAELPAALPKRERASRDRDGARSSQPARR